jgi:uncharacterized protein YkwD
MTRWLDGPHRLARVGPAPAGLVAGWWARPPCPDGFAEPWTKHLATKQVLVHQDLTPMLSCPHTSYAGENIAYGFETPRALVSAWMHSAGHRANILSPHFHRIGVSGWRATDGVTYATQDFVG